MIGFDIQELKLLACHVFKEVFSEFHCDNLRIWLQNELNEALNNQLITAVLYQLLL